MGSLQLSEDQFRDRVRLFSDFFNSQTVYRDGGDYREKIRGLVRLKQSRLIVNIDDLRSFSVEAAHNLQMFPMDYLPAAEKALSEFAQELREPIEYDLSAVAFHVGIEGSFGEFHLSPRFLTAKMLSRLVCIDGIVTSCSLVRPKLLKSVHYVEARNSFVAREYRDATMISANQMPTSSNTYPQQDADGNKLSTDFGLSTYRDHQIVSIQEMPERAPAGQLPRSVDVILDDDLVDCTKPGDRVQVVGVYRGLAGVLNGAAPAKFRTLIVTNNIRALGKEISAPTLSDADISNIKAIAKRKDVFELLSRSVAPSIYGHEYIKKAVLLMLLGGKEQNLENGTHIRGDINIMMVGDPSTAKSQILRFILGIAPLAVATTGRGSSGVGLTAAVVGDKETGERRLEAGAMVLADRGVVCIDEFDKMNDTDRVAIHEVMEQQTVTIAKAGIHTSLNARCSVIAAANPIHGQYKETATPQENIRLPDSLLSRFDLLFIVLDSNNPHADREIASHVLKMHRYVPPGVEPGAPLTEKYLSDIVNDEQEGSMASDSTTPVFLTSRGDDVSGKELLSVPFLKKFIFYAKAKIKPTLTKSASDVIVEAFAEFRQQRDLDSSSGAARQVKTYPVTVRTLETLIRLATAHAKLRLSARVEKKDAKIARDLIHFCLYKEVKAKRVKKRRTENVEGLSDENDNSDASSGDESGVENRMKEMDLGVFSHTGKEGFVPRSSSRLKEKEETNRAAEEAAIKEEDEDIPYSYPSTQPSLSATQTESSLASTSAATFSSMEKASIQAFLHAYRSRFTDQTFVSLSEFSKEVETKTEFGIAKVKAVLTALENENKIMMNDAQDLLIFI